MNNIMIEFTRKDKRFNESKLIQDFYNHVENNWFRLVGYDKKDNKVRIYSNYRDIAYVLFNFKNQTALGAMIIED